MTVVLPFTLTDGSLADASQVMANFNALKAAIEGTAAAAAGTDVYQSGVLASTDWTPGAGSIVGGTGVLSFTTFGGAAWLPGPVSGLVRTFTTAVTVGGLKPPVLPGPSGFVCVGVELTASGAEAVVSVVSGAEQVSEAAALEAAHSPAISNGKSRVRDVILKNNAGTYEIKKERDRRPWARGAHAIGRHTASVGAKAPKLVSADLQFRVECSGAPLQIGLQATTFSCGSASADRFVAGFFVDGVSTGTRLGAVNQVSSENALPLSLVCEEGITAGSHLFAPWFGSSNSDEVTIEGSATEPITFWVRELQPTANNGAT